ncbi:MAG: hypothetical protein AB8G95_10340 [Anaerolineae bacterium]
MKFKRSIIWQVCSLLLLIPLVYIGFFSEAKDPQPQTSSQRSPALGQMVLETEENTGLEASSTLVTPTLSLPVSSLPQISADVLPELVREINPRISHALTDQPDQTSVQDLQTAANSTSDTPVTPLSASIAVTDVFTTPILNFAGSPFTQVHPPDTVGAIGKDYYIQMVNGTSGAQFRIYDRLGALVQGPIALDSLSSGDCSAGAGDPIVLYDQFAERWFMSEFHSQGGSKVLCHYISQTGDPTGSWYAYEFEMPNFPDYPKYGLWPSAYIGSANEVGGSGAGPVPAIYAFDREKMLNGEPAGYIRFVPPRLNGFGFQAFTPVDIDGQFEPASESPALYLRHRDDEVHNSNSTDGADFIEIWSLTPNFANPDDSSFTQIGNIAVSEFDSTMCGVGSFECVPQKDSFRLLDPVREVLMHRVQYMNHGTHQTIVGNLVTDTTGNNQHGIFWFELVNTGNGWFLNQDGILAPDSAHRWMGSIAMDTSQNIAMVYNVSSSSSYPSLRYTGRNATMPLGTLINQEGSIAEGTAANSSSRYGDYNSLTLDPLDNCTFWATGQFNSSTVWSTQIATFKFPNCKAGPKLFFQKPSPTPEVLLGTDAEIVLSISASEAFTESVALASFSTTSGTIIDISPNLLSPVVTPTLITVTISGATLGQQTFGLTGTSLSQEYLFLANFTVVPELTVPTTLIYPPNGAKLVAVQPLLEWEPVTGATSYQVELSADPEFITGTQTYSDVQGISFEPTVALASDQVIYWRVRPLNAHSTGPWATAAFQTEPMIGFCQSNETPSITHRAGFETDLSGWSVSGSNSSWAISNDQFSEGLAAVKATGHAFTSTQKLTSPPLTLAPLADSRWLAFDIWRDVESSSTSCHDGLVLEIEQDGVWEVVDVGKLKTDPYDFDISAGAGNVLEGNQAWCGVQGWTSSLVDVSTYSGDIRLRYHFATDTSVGREGVYLDDIHLYECNPQSYTSHFPFFFKTD